MKRILMVTLLALVASLLVAAPASAQYGPPPPPPPADGPVIPRAPATVSDRVVVPGETVSVSTPPIFAPSTPVTVSVIRVRRGADPEALGSGTATPTGVTTTVTVPDLPPGIYFLYVTGVDSRGRTVVAITPIIIRRTPGGGMSAAVAAPPEVLSSAAAVPAPVAEVLPDLAPEAESAVVEAVTNAGAGLVLSPEGTLQVRTAGGLQDASTLPTTGSDGISQQVTIGAALLLAGTGLVALRRGRGRFSK